MKPRTYSGPIFDIFNFLTSTLISRAKKRTFSKKLKAAFFTHAEDGLAQKSTSERKYLGH